MFSYKKYQQKNLSLGYIKKRDVRKQTLRSCLYILVAFALIIPVYIFQRTNATSDLTPPTVVSASVTTGSTMDTVNTTNDGYNESDTSIVTSDNLSGTSAPLLVYTSPSGKQTATGGSNNVDASDVWRSIVLFPRYSEAGTWTATLYLEDYSGNKITYTDSQLQAMGINVDITLTGQSDTTDPVLASLTRTNPGVLDVTNEVQPAHFLLHITDNMSGVGIPSLVFTSQSGNQYTYSSLCNVVEGSASATAADYICDAYFQQYAESGIWTPDLFISDSVGDTVHFSNADLLARGIDARVTTTGTSDVTPPTVTDADMTFANPPSDNIPFGSAVITVTGNLSDNLSGINGTTHVSYTSPLGRVAEGGISAYDGAVFAFDVALPVYAEGGAWTPSIYVQDVAGNQHTYSSSELAGMGINLGINVSKNITEAAAPGGTVTSDYEGDGATSANPVEASVTAPSGGPVSIVVVQSSAINDSTNGYTFFDRQLSITAPTESAENPLTLSFMIDSSVVPVGESAATLQVTRNGTTVPECTNQTTATPNPCVFSRQTLSGGDLLIKIHSTTASAWASGFPTHTNDYNFVGFMSGTKDYPKVNKVQANQVVAVDMKIKGVPQGVTDILASGEPTSQRVNCDTLSPVGSAVATLSPKNNGLEHEGKNKFEYEWRTDKSWKNTCRVFNVQLKDGSRQKALFKF